MFNNTDAIMREIEVILPEATALRRRLHETPEIGNKEHMTSALIADVLDNLGYEVSRPMGTSVVAMLRGACPGKTVAFRADMDALPVHEETDLPYASRNPGIMHACGHDIHMAGLLGAAMFFSGHRELLKGNIKLLFQPDEEGYGGAKRMIDAGCLENPAVDAVFGAHINPNYPVGTIVFKPGKFYAGADIFRIIVRGQGCHGAYPDQGIDALSIAAHIICAVEQIVSRRISPTDSAVITFGTCSAGTARNVVAGEAVLDGVIRALGTDTLDRIKLIFKETVEGIAKAMGAEVIIEMNHRYPGIETDPDMTEISMNAVSRLLGSDHIRISEGPTMVTEDYGFFLKEVPGTFYEIGVSSEEYPAYPLHNSRLSPDENSLKYLIAAHVASGLAVLNQL